MATLQLLWSKQLKLSLPWIRRCDGGQETQVGLAFRETWNAKFETQRTLSSLFPQWTKSYSKSCLQKVLDRPTMTFCEYRTWSGTSSSSAIKPVVISCDRFHLPAVWKESLTIHPATRGCEPGRQPFVTGLGISKTKQSPHDWHASCTGIVFQLLPDLRCKQP